MWYNSITIWVLNSPMHRMFSGNTMIIKYVGQKSGKPYRVPIGYLQVDEALLTVSYKRRTWWRNLRGGAYVTVRLQGKDLHAHAEVIEDEQGVAQGLRTFIGGNPRLARMLGVKLDANSQPEVESLLEAARERVVVRTKLE